MVCAVMPAQGVDLIGGAGLYYHNTPISSGDFAIVDIIFNLRAGVNFDVLFPINDTISVGAEFHLGYITWEDDYWGTYLGLFDIGGRAVASFDLSVITVKPYFGYSAMLRILNGDVTAGNYLEGGARLVFSNIYIETSYLYTFDDSGLNHLKFGAGYEILF